MFCAQTLSKTVRRRGAAPSSYRHTIGTALPLWCCAFAGVHKPRYLNSHTSRLLYPQVYDNYSGRHSSTSAQHLLKDGGAGFPARIISGLSHAMSWQSPTTKELYMTKRSSFVLDSHETAHSNASCMRPALQCFTVRGLYFMIQVPLDYKLASQAIMYKIK